MSEYEVFKNIPLGYAYEWLKNDFYNRSNIAVSNVEGRTPQDGASGVLATFYDDAIEENGLFS